MATCTITGKYFLCRGGVVKFFGVEGRQDDSVLERIKKDLSEFSPKQLDRLAQVHVGPPSAGALYCSGIITIRDLKRAREKDNGWISIPDVKINERRVELVVKEYLGNAINYTNTAGFEIGLP